MVKNILLATIMGLTPDKKAIMLPATREDQACIDGVWCSIIESDSGIKVDAIQQIEQSFAVGDILGIRTIKNERRVYVKVQSIQLKAGQGLTDADIRQLGYTSRDAYMDDWGDVLEGRVWFFNIEHLIPGDMGLDTVQ